MLDLHKWGSYNDRILIQNWQGLQWTLYFFTTIYFLCRVHKMSKKDPIENPDLTFQIAYYFFDTTFLVVLFLSFGRQAKMMMDVLDDLQMNNHQYYRRYRNAKKVFLSTNLHLAWPRVPCLQVYMYERTLDFVKEK